MKLTKFKHACFTIEDQNQTLIVDPGELSTDLVIVDNVVGIIITHEHSDHMDLNNIARIFNANPRAVIFCPPNLAATLKDFNVKAVRPGDVKTIASFTVEFSGGSHAIIHSSLPTISNLAVMINERIFYPGDSLTDPGKPVDTLALPVAAPWLKLSESVDFVRHINPRFAFPTHDEILSNAGKKITDTMVSSLIADTSIIYKRVTGIDI